jgi:hypothetical protein
MFASSILHICVFLISFGIIKHLWHTGNMKMYYLIVKFYMFYKVCFILNYFGGFDFWGRY